MRIQDLVAFEPWEFESPLRHQRLGPAPKRRSVDNLESVASFEGGRRDGLDLTVVPADEIVVGRVRFGVSVVAGKVEDRTGPIGAVVTDLATDLEWPVRVATSTWSSRPGMTASIQVGLAPSRTTRTPGPCCATSMFERFSYPVLTLL